MARAYINRVMGDKRRGYNSKDTKFGDGVIYSHIEVVCDNGVVVTVHPDGTVGRKDWSERGGGMPTLTRR